MEKWCAKTDGKKTIKIICDSMIFLGSVMLCMPIIIMLTNSFESPRQILDYYYSGKTFTAFRLVPEILSADQYYAALISNKEYVTALMNSVEYAVISASGQLFCAAVSAYGLSLCRGKWVKWVIAGLLFTMLIPYQVVEVPIYLIMRDMTLAGSKASVIIQNIFHPFPTSVMYFLITGKKKETIEAAQLDGAGAWHILGQIILPQINSGMCVIFILQYIDTWNMIEQPLIFLQSTRNMPLSVLLPRLVSDNSGYAFGFGIIFLLPVFLLYLSLQEEIEHALADGLYVSGS